MCVHENFPLYIFCLVVSSSDRHKRKKANKSSAAENKPITKEKRQNKEVFFLFKKGKIPNKTPHGWSSVIVKWGMKMMCCCKGEKIEKKEGRKDAFCLTILLSVHTCILLHDMMNMYA